LIRYNRTILAFTHDLAAAALAFAFSMFLRLGGDLMERSFMPWFTNLGIFVATCAVVFSLSGVYRGVWRYVSVRDLAVILRSVTIAVIVFVPVGFLLTRLEGVPRSLPAILWFVLLAFLSGSRLLVRLIREGRLDSFWQGHRRDRVPVLIVGAGDEAELFIRATQSDLQSPYHVVGVLDEKDTRVGRQIHGVDVLGTASELQSVVKDLKQRDVAPARLVLSRAASRMSGITPFLAEAHTLGLSLSRLPSIAELHAQNNLKPNIQPIALEDLLGRAETVLDRQAMSALVAGKRVLITGAGGTIGSELVRQIAALSPSHLALVENSELNLYTIELEIKERHAGLPLAAVLADVRDHGRINSVFAEYRPHIVFHAAALKHVPMAEANIRETLLTNVMGTAQVADAAEKNGVEVMVLISTDKAVRPSSVMGATKRMAEQYCQALDRESKASTRFLTVRFGNVLGSTGSVVPRFREQIAKGGPVTVTHPDMSRYFMTVREAVELVLQASAHALHDTAGKGRIMVLDMGEPVKIVDLARQMIRLAGLRPEKDIAIIYTGLRPGEKLHEQLFDASEKLTPSGADGVLLAAAVPLPLTHVQRDMTDLYALLRDAATADQTLRDKINHMVPEFGDGTSPDENIKRAQNG
jgi:O-antigen biosynthesis protein WbqV